MVNQSWLDAVEKELVHRSLPPSRIRRMVEELRDHLLDLEADPQAGQAADVATQRLGSPVELAEAAWENHVACSYVGRHPVVGFVLLPIPLTLLGWFLAVVAVILLFHLGGCLPWEAMHLQGKSIQKWPTALFYLATILDFSVRVLPPIAAAILCCSWARKAARGWMWSLAACLLIAAVAGLLHSTLRFPVEPGTGRWGLGFGFPGGKEQLLQLFIPVAVGLWRLSKPRSSRGNRVSAVASDAPGCGGPQS